MNKNNFVGQPKLFVLELLFLMWKLKIAHQKLFLLTFYLMMIMTVHQYFGLYQQ